MILRAESGHLNECLEFRHNTTSPECICEKVLARRKRAEAEEELDDAYGQQWDPDWDGDTRPTFGAPDC